MTEETPTTRDDGGQAYPTPHYSTPNGDIACGSSGLSLRDYFAGQVLIGRMSGGMWEEVPTSKEQEWIDSCYKIADLMLKARQQ